MNFQFLKPKTRVHLSIKISLATKIENFVHDIFLCDISVCRIAIFVLCLDLEINTHYEVDKRSHVTNSAKIYANVLDSFKCKFYLVH